MRQTREPYARETGLFQQKIQRRAHVQPRFSLSLWLFLRSPSTQRRSFRLSLLRGLRLPLPLAAARCRCQRSVGVLGDCVAGPRLPTSNLHGRIQEVADGSPVRGGSLLAVDTTVVSPLSQLASAPTSMFADGGANPTRFLLKPTSASYEAARFHNTAFRIWM